MSSIDLHNQYGYQMQLSEAIAIVYSPIVALPGYKTFRVKDSEKAAISKCNVSGFHKHLTVDQKPAYEECSHVNYV